jgi:hypothetical protein
MTNDVRHSRQPYEDGRGGAALATARQARRRLVKNNLLAQGANAFTVALAAFILLLLLGAEILDWRWLVPIPLAAATAGALRVWRRAPSLYRAAQIVDRRMGLADALSTAIFFHSEPEPAGASAETRRCQAERADSVARSVNARRAIPYTLPRAAYAGGALFLLASSLFALRYGVTRRLDLKPPLAAILNLDMGWNQRVQAKAPIPDPPPKPEPKQEEAQAASGDQATRRDRDPGAGKRDPSQAGAQSNRGQERSQEQSVAKDTGEQRDQQQDAASNDQQRSTARQAGEQQSAKESAGEKQAASSERGKPNGDSQSAGLMDRFRDAVQNLISKMRPAQQQRGSGQQQAENDRGKSEAQQSGANQQQARNGGPNGNNESRSQSGKGEADRSAEGSTAAAKGQGGSADSAADGGKPGNGAGNEDGKKDIRQAEQLAAMGKISEILGKRSADLSGEATVEVQSTDQQLRTPYAERTGGRSSTGGEIGRDEVPPALQNYIERYFEQVRKEKRK